MGTSGHVQVRNTIIASNFAGGNGGGIAVANGTAEIQAAFIGGTWQRSLIRDNDAVGNGGGVWFDGAGNVDQRKWIIDRTDLERNTAGGEGGGLYLDWGGNTTNTRPASISDTMLNTNTANKGGGIYLKASTEFGTGVKIHNSAAMSEPGIGMYVHASTKNLGDKGIEITGSRMFEQPESPFGANSIATPGPIEMPSALYIEEGAEFILADAMIYDNDGYGVSGAVISLGNNYAENSLSSSSGWIETDIVT